LEWCRLRYTSINLCGIKAAIPTYGVSRSDYNLRLMLSPDSHRRGILQALAAAALFGLSTPLAKALVGSIGPVMLAGLLYAGSGIGLSSWLLLRRIRGRPANEAPLSKRDAPWLAGAVLFGGVLGPILLMLGLAKTPASSASLLLNLEGVLTAVFAWVVFRENVDRRVLLGMLAIVAGGVLMSWSPTRGAGLPWSSLAIVGACLCWALDNNLTRPVAGGDPVQIAAIKGGTAGVITLTIALVMGNRLPNAWTVLAAGLLGFVGYGLSLVLFVHALRYLGTARTGAYFSTAPFVGAAVSLLLFSEQPGPRFWLAGALMALGVWLHVRERHEHTHGHEALTHDHRHRHDEHHQHTHDVPWTSDDAHAHPHRHEPLVHSHPHYPDAHHRHRHS
jgi:drug/metabolite transporter (DMT)-like permease